MGYFKILIKNGNLFDGYKFCGKKDIFISNGKIEKIDDEIIEESNFVFDVQGKIVAPGLVDIHTHIYGVSHSDIGTPADSSSFPFGVTAVCDGCSEFGDETFLNGLKTKVGAFVPVWVKHGQPDFETARKLIKKYGNKTLGIKAYFDVSVSAETSLDTLKEICNFAHSKSLRVMVHSSNSATSMEKIVATLSKGDILTHIYHGGENNTCLLNDFSAFKLAKEKGVILDTGFAGHVHTDFSVLKKAMAGGWFPNTISTDITNLSAFTRGGRYGLTLCMSLCRHFGMDEAEILKAVTTSAANAVGRTQWGRIEVGKAADIAILEYTKMPFDFSPFVACGEKGDYGYNCYLTLSDGQIVWRR